MFGTDLTWLGWVYVSLSFLVILWGMVMLILASTVEHVSKGVFYILYTTIWLIGFFTVGYVR